jgi:hypothetical protein
MLTCPWVRLGRLEWADILNWDPLNLVNIELSLEICITAVDSFTPDLMRLALTMECLLMHLASEESYLSLGGWMDIARYVSHIYLSQATMAHTRSYAVRIRHDARIIHRKN